MSDSGGGVAGTFRRLFGRSSGKGSKGASGRHGRLERRHSSVDAFGRSPRRRGPGARGEEYTRHSFAEGAGDELRARYEGAGQGPVSASSKLQQAMMYVDLPRHLMLEFMQQEQRKLEAQEQAAVSAAAAKAGAQGDQQGVVGGPGGGVPNGVGAGGDRDGSAGGAGPGTPRAGGDVSRDDSDAFLRPTMDGVVAVGGSPMPPARDRASSFQDRRARLLAQARARVIAWVDEGLQRAPGTVAKLQVMNLLPAVRDVVQDSGGSPDGSDGRLASVPVTPGAARSRAASVGARLMAAHKSIYLSQQPIPSVAKLLEFLDALAGQAPASELETALAAAHAAHTAVPVVAALAPSPRARARSHSNAAAEGDGAGDAAQTPVEPTGTAAEAAGASPGGEGGVAAHGSAGSGAGRSAEDGEPGGGGEVGAGQGTGAAAASGDGPTSGSVAAASDGSDAAGGAPVQSPPGNGDDGGSGADAGAGGDAPADPTPAPAPAPPPSDLEVFTAKLKDAGAAAIVELLRAFITSFRALNFERLYDANVSPDSDDEWSFDPPSNAPMSPDTSA